MIGLLTDAIGINRSEHPILAAMEELAVATAQNTFGVQQAVHLTALAHAKKTTLGQFGLHADKCNIDLASPDGPCDSVTPNTPLTTTISLHLRQYTMVIYFSNLSNSTGGEFVFAAPFARARSQPTHAIQPRCGRGVIFRADHSSPHGINRGALTGTEERIAMQIWMKNVTQHVVMNRNGRTMLDVIDKVETLQSNLLAEGHSRLTTTEANSYLGLYGNLDWSIYHALQVKRKPKEWFFTARNLSFDASDCKNLEALMRETVDSCTVSHCSVECVAKFEEYRAFYYETFLKDKDGMHACYIGVAQAHHATLNIALLTTLFKFDFETCTDRVVDSNNESQERVDL